MKENGAFEFVDWDKNYDKYKNLRFKKKERQYTSVWMDVDCDNYIEFR